MERLHQFTFPFPLALSVLFPFPLANTGYRHVTKIQTKEIWYALLLKKT